MITAAFIIGGFLLLATGSDLSAFGFMIILFALMLHCL